jgi:hypothetical protein
MVKKDRNKQRKERRKWVSTQIDKNKGERLEDDEKR